MSVLKSLKIDIDFMFLNEVHRWKDLCDYKKAKETVDSFKVVNDTAESRGADFGLAAKLGQHYDQISRGWATLWLDDTIKIIFTSKMI